MGILDRKLRRDLVKSWGMLLAVAAIIAVGIGCFIGMLSASRNLLIARTDYYSTCRLADFWIDLKKGPVQEVSRLAMVPGVSEIRQRIQFQVVLDLPDAIKPVGAMVISLPDAYTPVINNIILRKGTYFTHGRANEVIVSEKFAKARGIEPGDTLVAVLNNQRKNLIVTGTAISAEFVYLAAPGSMVNQPENYGLMYIKRSFAEDSFGFSSACNSVVGLLAPEARKDPGRTVAELSRRLESFGVFAGTPRAEQFSPMVLDGEMTQLRRMAVTLPSFFLVVAALVLNVLMTRLAEQQRTIIGTLKALGYGNRELMWHFLKFAAAAGTAGGLLGCLMGYWLGGVMTGMYQDVFSFPRLVNRFYPGLSLAGIVISVGFAILGTLKGVRRVMRLEPAEAMRTAAPPAGGAVFLERWRLFWKHLGAQWQMILRGILRNKGRTLVSVFAAALGGSIVVLAFGFVDSMDKMVAVQFETALRSDYHLTFNKEMDSACVDEIRRLPGVIHAEPVFNVPCTFQVGNRTKKGAIMGIACGSRLTIPLDAQGRAVAVPTAGLLMTDRLMAKLGVAAGDTVDVLPVKGERIARKMPVVKSVASMMGLSVYADYRWLNRTVDEQSSVSEVRIQALHALGDKQAFMERIKTMPGLEALSDLGDQKRALVKQLDGAMRGTAVVMIIFAAVIFFGTILNGTLIALSERQRETATFRTMGYYENEVGRLFLRENLINNVIGTLVGMPLGHVMLTVMMKGMATEAYAFPAALAPMSFVYTLALTICFVLLSQIVVVRSLRAQNWVAAMSLKE
ncbi:MAG: FtsX-like permease family protein [Pseudomonadota bacterium]